MPTAILSARGRYPFEELSMARQPLHKTLGRQLQRLQSNNYPELAKIGLGIHFNHNALSKTSLNKPLHPRYNLDTSVMSIDLFPG